MLATSAKLLIFPKPLGGCCKIPCFLFQYTVAMLGYGPEDKNAVMELTYNYGVTEYDKGNAYGQVWAVCSSLTTVCFGALNVYKTCTCTPYKIVLF